MANLDLLKTQINQLAVDLGFQQLTVSDVDTGKYFPKFKKWVEDGYHGNMSYLERNQALRKNPSDLHPGTCRVLSLRYNYLPENANFAEVLRKKNMANISRYALGRDYHKLMRKKLKHLANSIKELCLQEDISEFFNYRVLVDSAPVLETSFAEKSGLGWKGKHTLVINEEAGSWFFLGEIFINLPIEVDSPVANQCASCTACIRICPTNAIIEPYKVDARRCISYLNIENQEAIPVEFRKSIGNRIYGCDDCQLVCPWNRFAQLTKEMDFEPRNHLDNIDLTELFCWTEQEFFDRLQGNPIRRIGFESWQRNIAVALGNCEPNTKVNMEIKMLLVNKITLVSPMVDEHIQWALKQLEEYEQDKASSPAQMKTEKLIRTIEKMLPRDS
ncbi:MAG: tRNA epoxyqueuosine(34) reductase QueG [Kangiellaceae bacterium]|nr:tRNA epoxyqueuosine(34) reductase QueG [Kangiellaceae bacterium]